MCKEREEKMLDGILPIYKERGMTSHDVVFKLRKVLKMKKIGHAGTLDPDVDGVLLVLLNNSTKVSDYAMNLGKKYRAEICIGIKTTTEDASGEVVEEANVPEISLAEIKTACNKLVGTIEQKPPIYSAIKVKGKKLYEYARAGQFDVEIPTRKVEIYSIDLLEDSLYFNNNKVYFTIDVHCGKGTYIRTLASQLGELFGYPSCMNKLTRTASGKISIDNTLSLEEVSNKLEVLENYLLPKEFALEAYTFFELPKFRAQQVMNGLRFRKNQFPELNFNDGVVFTYKYKAIAVYYLKNPDDDLLHVKTTFPQNID